MPLVIAGTSQRSLIKEPGRIAVRILAVILALSSGHCLASTIGTNPPAQSITRERIASLPAPQRRSWLAYTERSDKQRRADKESLRAELKRAGLARPIEPAHDFSARSMPLDRPADWYAGSEARHIARVIVSFQTPAGGWGKNIDMAKEERRTGEAYAPDNLSRFLSADDYDTPSEPDWNYVGTIDNDATVTQLKFLAKVVAAAAYDNACDDRESFLHGMDYLLAAQYPNGGWPQVWPLEGRYHDAITYNDDAMVHVLDLMRHVADAQGEFSFVPRPVRERAAASFKRGIGCILRTQIVSNGRGTVWPQQADPLTLQPVSARNFEPPAEASGESAGVLLLLMNDLLRPNVEEQQAIRAAAAWFRKTAIYGQKWQSTPAGRDVVAISGAGPIWARYYQIGTDRPIFADRDKTIHDTVHEISKERRNGYRWYNTDPLRALDRFDEWAKDHPEN